jgi:co-chaperonin GroES (HSP10)
MLEDKNLTVLFDNVLVQLLPRDSVSAGGIHIPDRAQKVHQWGTVLAVGQDVKDLNPDDEVYVPLHSGTLFAKEGHEFIIIKQSILLAKREHSATDNEHGEEKETP